MWPLSEVLVLCGPTAVLQRCTCLCMYAVKDIKLEPYGVPDLHLRSQGPPPKSGSVPDGCKIYLFQFYYISNCM